MTDDEKKKESIRDWVSREFAGIPQEWVKVVSERLDDFAAPLPMWGTLWIVDSFIGEKLMKKSRRMCGDAEELRDNLDAIEDNDEREKVKSALDELAAEKISWGETALLDDYIDEEMAGARNITGTAAYIYEIDGRYVIGVHGAGWDFYDGVWNNLYDLCGMEWHKHQAPELSASSRLFLRALLEEYIQTSDGKEDAEKIERVFKELQ